MGKEQDISDHEIKLIFDELLDIQKGPYKMTELINVLKRLKWKSSIYRLYSSGNLEKSELSKPTIKVV